MTYIEFFDNNVTENICGCLVCVPDRVILIGDSKKKLKIHTERYHSFFLDRGHDIEFIYKAANRNNLSNIVNLLSDLIEEYDDCVIDLTGGQELMLVAAGIVYHRYRDMDIQMHRFNLRSNKLYDCDNDGNVISVEAMPELSIIDNIRLFGGKVVFEEEKHGATYPWDWSADFRSDIELMWRICERNTRAWNYRIGLLAAGSSDGCDDPLTVSLPLSDLTDEYENKGTVLSKLSDIITDLRDEGLITIDDADPENVTITFKNEQIRRCLTKEGLVLELKITLCAMLAKDEEGDYVYTDVMNGVYIDWDGDVHTQQEGFDTENEIDVMMMHGLIPVFVSCKNGYVDINELYKLSSVADRFGGKYAKKVLIATSTPSDSPHSEHVRQRALEMNINVVEKVRNVSAESLERTIASLWLNPPQQQVGEKSTENG